MKDLSKIDTTIYLGEIAVHQPVTAFTNIIIAALGIYFFIRLTSRSKTNNSIYYWRLFFLTIGLANFLGGCSHGLFAVHEGVNYKAFWLSMQLFNGFAVFAAQHATLNSVLKTSKSAAVWRLSYLIQLILYIPAVFIFQSFVTTIVGLALGLIPIMIFHFKDAKKEPTSKWIAYGILVAFGTAFVYITKVSIHVYFNHLDIAHIFLMINLILIFIGIKNKPSVVVAV